MQKCKKHKKYKNKNSLAPAISIKKQNRVKTQKPKRYKKVFKCKKSKPAKMHKNTT